MLSFEFVQITWLFILRTNVALSVSKTQEPPTEVRHSQSVDKWWKRRMKMVASISDLKRHSEPSQRPTLGIHWAALVAQFRQGGGTIQLYTRHCRAVFRTCSTGWTAAIAFMGARWGASHQAWSRQTLRSCSLSPKVIIFYPAAGWPGWPNLPSWLPCGHSCNPIFWRWDQEKLCCLGALSLVSRKLLPNPWPARRLVMT